MRKNIFVMGLEDYARGKLETIRSSDECNIHGLLAYEAVVKPEQYDFDALLDQARRTLNDFDGSIDAIIGHWDFPVTELLPILCQEYGLRGPSLDATLKCGHKYWSRVEQAHAVPDHTPHFVPVDPFSEHAFEIDMPYPFWIKPVKSFASALGFKVENGQALNRAIRTIRENIRRIGEPFNVVLRHANIPPEIARVNGNCCIVEEIIGGKQGAIEGYVFNGEVHVHAALDMIREPNRTSFSRMQYPSELPSFVLNPVIEAARDFVKHIGLDNTMFNLEFFWDEKTGRIWIIELNPRMSQSHSHFFLEVDGMSNHQIAIDIALGRKPDFPHRQGRYNCAAKFIWRHFGDALVTEVPSEEEIRELEAAMPGTEIYIEAEKGRRLSEQRDQDPYSFELAIILIGGENTEDLLERYERCKNGLTFKLAESHRLQESA